MPVYEAKESSFENIPEGTVVHAVVKSIEEATNLDFARLNWKFEVTSSPYEGWTINDGSTPKMTISPPSKLYEWATILLGRGFDEGELLNTDDLIGLPCRIEIGWKADRNNDPGNKEDRDDPDNKFWMRVETLMPATGVGTTTAEDVFG